MARWLAAWRSGNCDSRWTEEPIWEGLGPPHGAHIEGLLVEQYLRREGKDFNQLSKQNHIDDACMASITELTISRTTGEGSTNTSNEEAI